jgi:hypothetical protein
MKSNLGMTQSKAIDLVELVAINQNFRSRRFFMWVTSGVHTREICDCPRAAIGFRRRNLERCNQDGTAAKDIRS